MRNRSNYGIIGNAITANMQSGGGVFSAVDQQLLRSSDIWVGRPDPPSNIVATIGYYRNAIVSFVAPTKVRGSPVISYTVRSNPENIVASGNASPIIVNNLTTGTAYTFTVTATNASGESISSVVSNSVTASIYMDYIVVGGGGGGTVNNTFGSGGPGGALEFATNTIVTPNTSYAITVGAGGPGYSGGGYGGGVDGGLSRITGLLTANGGENYGTFQTRTILQSGTTYLGGNGDGGTGSGGSPQGTGASDGGNGRIDSTGISTSLALLGQTYGIFSSGSYLYGGGGGAGNGGIGYHGGGNGRSSPTGVQNGVANTGGGGGGGGPGAGTARAGGSGLVIIKVGAQANPTTTGTPAVYVDALYKYLIFTGNGSISVPP